MLLAQQQHHGAIHETTFLASDAKRSVLHALGNGQREAIAYAPYGHRSEGGLFSLLGFNGERTDSVTGHYLLGNGYRAFNPVLMRFNSPDSMSPFARGGLNAYAYCAGDPVNSDDPTGHFSMSVFQVAVSAVVGVALLWGGAASKDKSASIGLFIASGIVTAGSFGIAGIRARRTWRGRLARERGTGGLAPEGAIDLHRLRPQRQSAMGEFARDVELLPPYSPPRSPSGSIGSGTSASDPPPPYRSRTPSWSGSIGQSGAVVSDLPSSVSRSHGMFDPTDGMRGSLSRSISSDSGALPSYHAAVFSASQQQVELLRRPSN
ncbi:RHS repeat-associated core domain-containing protein [Pseudomonas kilonensis]|uniref:RHS repeat-associated core domain-containing protein n=1 Tax=Pseudomonas kilonensis TaxID=132476 RepID=UPI003482FF7C